MEYKGIFVSEKLENGRIEITIETTPDKVRFSYPDNTFEWEIRTLHLEQGGSGKQLIYLKNSDSNDSIYTRDRSILKDKYLRSNISVNQYSKKIRSNFIKSRTLIFAVLLIILAIPLSIFIFRSFFVDKIAQKVPVKWESDIGDKLFSAVKYQYKIIENSVISAKMDSIFSPLVEVANYPEIDFKFHLCEDPTLNAFALPGGHIVVNSGAIHKIERIEELHGVLAHEIAHVTRRHHLRGLLGKAGIFLLFQGLFGNEAGLLSTIGESAGHLNSLFYSREYEIEADTAGFNYLTKANIDPRGMVEFFERIKKEYENPAIDSLSDKTKALSSYLSTHPDTDKRINYLKERIAQQNKEYKPAKYTAKDLQLFIEQKQVK